MDPAGDHLAERTLLLDPCRDDPEACLGYDPTGQIFSLNDNQKGEKSIQVFHLSRRRLRMRRLETMKIVIGVMKLSAKLAAEANSGAVDEVSTLLDMMRAADSAHAGMARYIAARPKEFGI
jgi:hypothetical protein